MNRRAFSDESSVVRAIETPIDRARHVHGIDIWTEISAGYGLACECVRSFLVMRAVC
jgi:hypothetical protein